MLNKIIINGARVHNLKNINVEIPKNKLTVITGLSGSGKSSLAFDTVYAEGQRRYVESLSSYARQFLGSKDKPDVDSIEGLSPAIALDQRPVSNNPRSTVGTITDIYDYLRVLYARIGVPHCPQCGNVLAKQTKEQILKDICQISPGKNVFILSPFIIDQIGEHSKILRQISRIKCSGVRIDDDIYPNRNLENLKLAENEKHTIELIIDNFVVPENIYSNNLAVIRNSDFGKSTDRAIDLSNGSVIIHDIDQNKDYFFTEKLACSRCRINIDVIEPHLFSFNSPRGACNQCKGLGTRLDLKADLLVPNLNLTISEGAIRPFARLNGSSSISQQLKSLENLGKQYDFSVNTVWKKLTDSQRDIILFGEMHGQKNSKKNKDKYQGVVNFLIKKYETSDSEYVRNEIFKYMLVQLCSQCNGKRLNSLALHVMIDGKNISEVAQMTIASLIIFLQNLKLSAKDRKIGERSIKEMISRLKLLSNVGLGYLTLDRSSDTLAGGEAQRTKLATQIGSGLSGVIYVLDEPSIGLHQKDNDKLIRTLKKLKELDNTVIVVEHDEATIMAADWVIDVGPGAGNHGGSIVAAAEPKDLLQDKNSLTASYLSGRKTIKQSVKKHFGNGKY